MSESKKDRGIAPKGGIRKSRAKGDTRDRNVTPPAPKSGVAKKPKKGERVMNAQLAARPKPPAAMCQNPSCGHPHEAHDLEDMCSECECRAWTPNAAPAPETTAIARSSDDPPPPPADPWWTPEREEAFKYVLQGIPQHQVASELGRDRHTIARWCEDERFVDRLIRENDSRFQSMRQRRAMQTVRLTEKTEGLAVKLLDKATKLAEEGKDDLGTRMAARDWLQEFREQSRREDEIYGLNGQRVDVNVHGSVQHNHKHKGVMLNMSFKDFLNGTMRKLGVDPKAEEIDGQRADEALIEITERALQEGSFLDELVEREKQEQLELAQASAR